MRIIARRKSAFRNQRKGNLGMNIVNIPNAKEFAGALDSGKLYVYSVDTGVVVFRTLAGGVRDALNASQAELERKPGHPTETT